MTDNSISAAASKSPTPQRHIDLEHIYGELQVVTVFIAATEQFLCDLRMAMPESNPEGSAARVCLQADTMLLETKRVVNTIFADLGDFIAASPAANCRVGELS